MDQESRHTVVCPKCGAENGIDSIHEAETSRATTCTECGEWFTVYDESG